MLLRYFRFVASILSPGQQLRLRNSLDLLMDTRQTLVDGVASLLGVNATTGTAVPMNLTDTAVWRALSVREGVARRQGDLLAWCSW